MAGTFKIVSRDIGSLFLIVGIITLFAIAVPIIFNEFEAIKYLLLTAGVFIGIGAPLSAFCKDAGDTTFKNAMITAALGWFFVSLIGCIPFLFMWENSIGHGIDFLSAFFESVAGWTGTGLTMVIDESSLPHTLQFWRSLIQWVGGVGVIVLTLAILARPGTGSFTLYKSEAREQKTHPSVLSTVRTIWWIFLLYTVLGVLLFYGVGVFTGTGMGLWESVNHCMTGLATGGFSVADNSMASYGVATQIAVIVMMMIGAIAFAAHYDLLKGRVKKFFTDAQTLALIILIIVCVTVLTIINLTNPYYGDNILFSLKESGFQFVSAITCTGFATTNLVMWGESAKLILSFAMIIGGAAGSTAGGIKLFRGVLLAKGAGWRIKRALSSPRRVFSYKLGNKSISVEQATDYVNEAAIISFLWIIILFIGVLVLSSAMQVSSIGDAIFEVCSAQGNVGLSVGLTGLQMPDIAKVTLILSMWIGRLEIIPIMVLIKAIISRKGI